MADSGASVRGSDKESYFEAVDQIERWLKEHYEEGSCARVYGLKRLNAVSSSFRTTAGKLNVLKRDFPDAFADAPHAEAAPDRPPAAVSPALPPPHSKRGRAGRTVVILCVLGIFAVVAVVAILKFVSPWPMMYCMGYLGNGEAQYLLGVRYANGNGVKPNYRKAAHWYRKSADNGCAAGQNALGNFYSNWLGMNRDLKEAAKWYRKAADQGYAPAQCNLGVCYEYGRGVTKDLEEAVKWYRKAADQGHTWAQEKLKRLGR